MLASTHSDLMMVVAGKSFRVTIHIQPLMIFYSSVQSLFHNKSPVDFVCFSITPATYLQVLCTVVSRVLQALCTIILVNKRQLLNSKRALDETAMTIGVSNQGYNHVLLESCTRRMNRNTVVFEVRFHENIKWLCGFFTTGLKCKCASSGLGQEMT